MTLSEMLALVRTDLKDANEPYRWSDDELERHIQHAVKDFSEAIPYEQKATLATTSGSREIFLSDLTGLVMVEAVEYPVDEFPRNFQPYSFWANTVTLLGIDVPDGSNAYIYYGKLHTLDGSSSTIPAKHEDLMAAGAAGYAAVEWAAYAINRVNLGGLTTPEEFVNWGNQRLDYFKNELKRLGRRNKVRVRRVYTI
ncbi:MAG: hypothetical protein Q7R50_05880 [Dehalococcoidales bacterium]|nr:hypothetical protein [Dehalococcoidales bacterium]